MPRSERQPLWHTSTQPPTHATPPSTHPHTICIHTHTHASAPPFIPTCPHPQHPQTHRPIHPSSRQHTPNKTWDPSHTPNTAWDPSRACCETWCTREWKAARRSLAARRSPTMEVRMSCDAALTPCAATQDEFCWWVRAVAVVFVVCCLLFVFVFALCCVVMHASRHPAQHKPQTHDVFLGVLVVCSGRCLPNLSIYLSINQSTNLHVIYLPINQSTCSKEQRQPG